MLNNDLAIFSNYMHNLCRLKYFFKSWVLNFQSCLFLSGMNARSLSIVLSFSTWESVENSWKLGRRCNFTKSILTIFLYANLRRFYLWGLHNAKKSIKWTNNCNSSILFDCCKLCKVLACAAVINWRHFANDQCNEDYKIRKNSLNGQRIEIIAYSLAVANAESACLCCNY